MKVLVTGANGFLAGHIIHVLCSQGYAVRAMLRPKATAPALAGLDVEMVHGQITDPRDVRKAVKGCSMVIHAAADTRQTGRSVEDYLDVNVAASKMIMESLQEQNGKRLLYISSSNTIGYGDSKEPGKEENPPSTLFMKSGYALSKYMAQQMLLEMGSKSSVEVIILNPGFMIGPMDFHPHSGKIFSMVLDKRIAFCPPGGKSFVDVRDVAIAVVNALQKGRGGSWYLLTGHNMTYRSFFQEVKALSNYKTMILTIPGFLMLMGGLIGSFLKMMGLRTSFHCIHARILCVKNYYNHAKASRDLGMSVRELSLTIQDSMEWIRSHRKIGHVKTNDS